MGSHIKRQDTKRLEVLGCACASGVSATFGTAFGGILFSIEFTSTAYLVKSLPKAFLCALSAMLVYFLLGALDDASLIGTTGSHDEVAPTAKHVSSLTEVGFFVAFGVVCGLFGVIFVWMVEVRLLTSMRPLRAMYMSQRCYVHAHASANDESWSRPCRSESCMLGWALRHVVRARERRVREHDPFIPSPDHIHYTRAVAATYQLPHSPSLANW